VAAAAPQENALISDVHDLREAREAATERLKEAATAAATRLRACENQLGRRDQELAAAHAASLSLKARITTLQEEAIAQKRYPLPPSFVLLASGGVVCALVALCVLLSRGCRDACTAEYLSIVVGCVMGRMALNRLSHQRSLSSRMVSSLFGVCCGFVLSTVHEKQLKQEQTHRATAIQAVQQHQQDWRRKQVVSMKV